MLTFILKRLLVAIPTLLGVLTVVFFVVRVAPGDPAIVILGESASAPALETLREQLGLNRPLIEQYFSFLGSVLQGDLGRSMISNQPVLTEVWRVLPYTFELTGAALLIGVIFGVPLGVISARYRNGWADYVVRFFSLLGLSFPAFISAILLLLAFAITIPLFPVIGEASYADPAQRLRALNLGLIMVAYITRVSRSSMLAVINQDYIRTAQAKGVPPGVVVGRHALRNALIPIVTVIGLYLGVLIGNSVLTEIVFNRPGLGKLIVIALNQRDYPTLQAMLVIYAVFIVLANILTDLIYGVIDPRVRNK
ncbi:ABC transporter permease [Chelatococcus asaccharovorans]|uniref:Peptide/nickel transport system permease protein/glutathione transport system permease protein n=1 Tax=Chelatococcus asaccharovorans TaxID=28210 RepID=A0A2V3TYT6_9HYPH|nr:ABC transporter permease [Chelatococcus asaccharovorans]MBS7704723.1 ABC transporter permease [Chelatococcus asaccharovorans]PXW54624.1 peptide/nickel transport system permease protein/glutathione transport system permease protein [Chelatococcus asaccharovorans]